MIRDEALRLFAADGPDAVSLRQVAAAAGVSPGLVVHHFGSKEGLREVVDQHVQDLFDGILGEMAGEGMPDMYDPAATGSLAEMLTAHLPPDSPVPAYLRRSFLSGGEAGRELFRRMFDVSRRALDMMVTEGMATPGEDPVVRAAFLLTNDLAVFLLRDHLTELLGVDPLSGEGLERWAREMLAVYAAGLLASPDGGRE